MGVASRIDLLTAPSPPKTRRVPVSTNDVKAAIGKVQIVKEVQHGVVQKPTFKGASKVIFSFQSIVCASYICSFGSELAINTILGAYYLKNFKYLGQTNSG